MNGERLRFEKTRYFRVRPLQVLNLAEQTDQRELWVVGLDGSPALQFTYSSGRAYGFAVAPDGENITLSLFNDQKGIELWLMDCAGKNGRILLACGAAHCSTPAWSPDRQYITYTREAAPFEPEAPPVALRLRMIHLATNQDLPIYSDLQVSGYGPSWSPDGTKMLSTRYEPVDQGYHTFVYRAEFTNGEVSTFLEGGEKDSAYGTPAWSIDDRIAFSLRHGAPSPARSIWIVRPDYLGGPTTGSNINYTHGFYSWEPWGTALIFLCTRLEENSDTEIAVYQLTTGEIQVLAEGAG